MARQISIRVHETPQVEGATVGAVRHNVLVWWRVNRAALTYAFVVVVALRVSLEFVAVLATSHLPEQEGLHPVFHASTNIWLDVWARWDSQWYLYIARLGYSSHSELVAFFPLYPVLMSTAATFLRHNYVLAGIVVSSVALFVALVYLFKLAELEFDRAVAERTVLYTAIYPLALFFLAVYTESLFLAVTVAALYHVRRGQWGPAGIAAALAGVTRANGMVLAFPLLYELWRQSGGSYAGIRSCFPFPFLGRASAVAAPAVGLLSYALYVGWLTHDRLGYVHRLDQPPWDRTTSLPWNTLISAVQNLQSTTLYLLPRAVNSTDLVFTLFLVEACVAAWWLLPRTYAIYLTASTILLLSSTTADYPLQSLPRYISVLFPCFLLLGRLGGNPRWDRVILLTFAPLLGLFTGLFATWYWIF